MKLALIQQDIEDASPQKNVEKALHLIRTAVSQELAKSPAAPVDLVVLPEFLQGNPNQPHPPHFVDTEQVVLARFCDLARELAVCIVPGTISHYEPDVQQDQDPTNKTILLNTAYFIDRAGNVAGEYHKKNLWHSERPKYTKGREPHTVFDTEFGKTGMLICWDAIWPEAFKQLAAQKVDLIVIPSFWTGADNLVPEDEDTAGINATVPADSESVFLRSAMTTRAFESNALVVYTNVGGLPSRTFIGLSQVALPMWGVLPATRVYDVVGLDALTTEQVAALEPGAHVTRVEESQPGVLETSQDAKDRIAIVEVNKVAEKLAHAEQVYKIRADAESEDWHY